MAWIRDVAALCGAASVSYGAWLIYEPAGFIVGGIIALSAAVLSARGDS